MDVATYERIWSYLPVVAFLAAALIMSAGIMKKHPEDDAKIGRKKKKSERKPEEPAKKG